MRDDDVGQELAALEGLAGAEIAVAEIAVAAVSDGFDDVQASDNLKGGHH